jgi:hypothetical protein
MATKSIVYVFVKYVSLVKKRGALEKFVYSSCNPADYRLRNGGYRDRLEK